MSKDEQAKPLTKKKLAEIEARNKARTTDYWALWYTDYTQSLPSTIRAYERGDAVCTLFVDYGAPVGVRYTSLGDAKFIANAPADMTALLAEVKRLQAENAELKHYHELMRRWGEDVKAMARIQGAPMPESDGTDDQQV